MIAERPLVIVSSRSFSSGDVDFVARLEAAGYRVERIATDHELVGSGYSLSRAHAWIAGVAPVTAAHFDAAPNLRILARYGVGYDAIDLAAASAHGVVVTNTPGSNAGAVAEHALALTLAALRGVVAGDRGVRAGAWVARRGREISALTVGVVGAGRIGSAYAARAHALGARVLGHDAFVDATPKLPMVTLKKLMSACEVVSLHVPGGCEIVTDELLDTARSGMVLVNTARADVVNEAAVAEALRDGRLAAYAADTLQGEGAGLPSVLLAEDLADRVIVTPHNAAQTIQAIDTMGRMATEEVMAVLAGRAPTHPVEDR